MLLEGGGIGRRAPSGWRGLLGRGLLWLRDRGGGSRWMDPRLSHRLIHMSPTQTSSRPEASKSWTIRPPRSDQDYPMLGRQEKGIGRGKAALKLRMFQKRIKGTRGDPMA